MKDWIRRALRTGLQTAVAYFATTVATVDWTNESVAKSALLGIAVTAIAMGLSAGMNYYDGKDKTEE